jgi:D-inositol-3-phosphate glycosyltransferase
VPQRNEAAPLSRLAEARGVTLHLEEQLGETDLVDRYQRSLVTVCAARLEPFGLTALESMACGTPVVAIEEAGFRDSVLDGETGFLVDPEPGAIAAAIDRLTADPGLAARLGRRGREWVEQRWSWEDAGRRLEAVLEETAELGQLA